MSVVLGSPVPGRLGITASPGGAFPDTAGTYISPNGAIVVPGGSLDRWYAYRATLGAARRSVVGFGDSTMFGSGGGYSWLQRIRDRAVGIGMADGGKGIFAGLEEEIVYDSPEVNGLVSAGTFGGGFADSFDNLVGSYFFDSGSPAGHTITLQFKATGARLWFGSRAQAGEFSYTVDGGAPVIVNAHDNPRGVAFVYLSGLSNTTHTLVVTNRGGRTALPPTSMAASASSPFATNPLSAGTYYYKAAYVFGGGETLPCTAVSAVVDGAQRTIGLSIPTVGEDSIRFYRATSPGGPFERRSVTANGGSSTTLLFTDDSTGTTSAGVNPASSGTTNLNTSSKSVFVALAPVNATGLSIQKHAVSGATIALWFYGGITPASPFTQSHNGLRYQTALGLTATDVDGAGHYRGAPVDTLYATNERVNPVLAMSQLGFNDLTGGSAPDLAMWTEYVKRFAGACYDASCDGIIISGQLPYNANWGTLGAARFQAVKDQALAEGLAFVDLFYPIGGPSLSYAGGTSNPHLSKAQYVAQADFIWDNLLGLTT